MKVAVLIPGSPRFCSEFDKFISGLVNYSSVDYFCYLWSNNPLPDKPGGYDEYRLLTDQWRDPNPSWAQEKIKSNLPNGHHLRGLKFADSSNLVYPKVTPHGAVVWSVWRMHYSWHQVDLMRQEYEYYNQPYDLVIRARPDCGIVGKIDCEKYSQTENIYVPNHGWHGLGHSICDIMALGNSHNMKIYNSVVNNSLTYVENGWIPFHPETILAFHLKMNNLNVRQGDWGYTIRPDLYEKDGFKTVNFGLWQ